MNLEPPSENDGMSHFVYAAILIPEGELGEARIIGQEACEKFLQGNYRKIIVV